MNPSVLPNFADPADHTAEGRTRAVAAILAAGLLRLRAPLATPDSGPKNLSESLPNRLAVWGEKSVTVSAG